MFAELAVFDNHRRAQNSGVKSVISQAAPPGIEDQRIARGITTFGDANQFTDMFHMGE